MAYRASAFTLCMALFLATGANAATLNAPVLDDGAVHVEVSFSSVELHGAKRELLVEWAATNPTKKVLGLLWWHTPLKGVRGDLFKISHQDDGKDAAFKTSVSYKGMIAKRLKGPYGLNNFIRIQPGETRSMTFDVTKFYDFHVAGNYTISLKDEAAYYMTKEVKDALINATTEADFSAPTTVHVNYKVDAEKLHHATVGTGALTARPVIPKFKNVTLNIAAGGSQTGVHCTSYQDTVWQTSILYAKTMVSCSSTCIKSGSCANANKYLGSTNSHESDVYSRSHDLFNSGITHYDCNPDNCGGDSTYAYVYPTDTTDHTIHLCSVYWISQTQNELYSIDSKPGTLIHESTHFNDIGATQDYVYGQAGCSQLALSDPDKAMYNADCYEYTAETHPSC